MRSTHSFRSGAGPEAAPGAVARTRGSAPLEFVLCLPFLLALLAMIVSVGTASMDKAGVAITARREVWKMRDDPGAVGPNLVDVEVKENVPLSVIDSLNPKSGMVYGESERQTRVFHWVTGPVESRSGAAVLGGSWDHRQITDFEDQPGSPHFGLIERVAGGDGAATRQLTQLLAFVLGGLPNQNEIDQAEQEKQQANEKYNEQRKKIEQEMDRIREEIKELEKERDALVSQRDAKQREKDALIERRRQLEDEAAKQNPVPQGLRDQINELTRDINKLTEDINNLNAQIQTKNNQIAAKQQELQAWQDSLNQADQELGKL